MILLHGLMKKKYYSGVISITAAFVLLIPVSPGGTPSDTASICKKWTWECSIGGLGGRDTLTPEKAGYTRKIEFTKKGKYREYRSDTLELGDNHVEPFGHRFRRTGK
jgi:hypothetical protein